MERANVIGFDTDRGYRLIELYDGDLLSGDIAADVLVVSTFVNDYAATPSSLVGQLKARIGVDLASQAQNPFVDLRAAFGCWVTDELPEASSFRYVLVAEMQGGSQGPRDAVNHAFVTLAALEAKGLEIESVAMPVLGAGDQGLSPEQVVPLLLKEGEAALERQQRLRRVAFVERDQKRAARLSMAMNTALGRAGVTLPKTEVVSSLKEDLAAAVASVIENAGERPEHLLVDLHRLASSTSHASYEVGVVARRLVEVVANDVLDEGKSGPLAKRIDDLGQHGVSPWIRGYMHTLRHLGNESVHESTGKSRIPPHLAEDDLTIALICMLRVLWFWRDYRAVPRT